MPEPDLYVKRSYCSEHMERDHWLDENFVCHGRDLAEVESHGYTWARHIGGGWYKLQPKPPRRNKPDYISQLVEEHDRQSFDTADPEY
jgi:hypothetical protein